MVKIRGFISKKAVPRGIDIDNTEYWQPIAITVKGKGSGENNNDEGNNEGETVKTKCTITISTIPENATIVATDEDGNVYNTKVFEVLKGKQVTIIGTPDASSTGYKPTTIVLTSEQTNQDSFNYTFVLDAEEQGEERTTINIVSNISGVITNVYDSENNLLNPGGANTVQNVLVGSVISIKPSKEGYKLKTSSHGTIVTADNVDSIVGITVEKNMLINITLDSLANEAPTISGLENDYELFSDAQNFVRAFKSTFYKIRIYGDLPVSLVTSWGNSSEDSLGGQSLTDVNQEHHGEQDVSITIPVTENVTGLTRTYHFNVIAENKSGQQVAKSFDLIQFFAGTVRHTVKIITKINNVVSGSSDIIRKIDGEIVENNVGKEVGAGSNVTFYASYLGKEFSETITVNDDVEKVFNFEVVNILLGTVKDENNNTFNTWDLTLFVPSLNIQKNSWRNENVPVIKGTHYYVTGRDTSGQRPDYNSGEQIADGVALNVIFRAVATNRVTIKPVWINPDTNQEQDVPFNDGDIKLISNNIRYNNGSAFPIGTKVGYYIEISGYEVASLSDSSNNPNVIVVGSTDTLVKVYLTKKVEYVDVTVNTRLNGSYATGAVVKLDGVLQGTGSPFVLQNLVNGRSYNLTVELQDKLPYTTAFVASPNKEIEVSFIDEGEEPVGSWALAVTVLTPSDALIIVNDYTDGQTYTGRGELYQQIADGHEITISVSKDGYLGKLYPAGAQDNPPQRILMDSNKNYLNITLEEVPQPSICYYSLNVVDSNNVAINDAIVEFAETSSGNFEEYPSKTYSTYVGRTVYWRVSKNGYVTQVGNSGVLSGSKTDKVTLVQEESNVNNNVLFMIDSIKDKDSDEDLTGVTVNLRLKGVDQEPNRIIISSDLDEVEPGHASTPWNSYLGKFGGVAAKGTDVRVIITKEGYQTYENTISIEPDYANKTLVLNVQMQTPKCELTLYPIQNISEEQIVPNAVYIKEGNDAFTENDRITLVGNRYRKQVNRGSNVYYMVLKSGYSGGKGVVENIQYSQNKAITLGAVVPPAETVEITVRGGLRHRGSISDAILSGNDFTVNDAPVPRAYDLYGYSEYQGTYVGNGTTYEYKFEVPKNTLVKFYTIYNNRYVSTVGSFSKNADIMMFFERQPEYVVQGNTMYSPNIYVFPMLNGEPVYNLDSEFSVVVRDKNNIVVPNYLGISEDHAKKYYVTGEVEIVNIKAELGYTSDTVVQNDYNVGELLTVYCDFVETVLDVTTGLNSTIHVDTTNKTKEIRFDAAGETKQITIESTGSWTIE